MRQISYCFLSLLFFLSACQTVVPAPPSTEETQPVTPALGVTSVPLDSTSESQLSPTPEANVIQVDSFEQEVYPFIQNGNCTFAEAITAANTSQPVDGCPAGAADGGLIALEAGTYLLGTTDESPAFHMDGSAWERTPNQMAGLPVVMGKVTINGNGATIKAEKNTLPTLLITYSPQATINDLTLSGGGVEQDTTYAYVYDGGNYWNAGIATLNRVRVENGIADNGGGISNGGSGSLDLVDCVISNNFARFKGGGIKNSGKLTMTSSTIEDNSAGDGGGLALFGGDTLILASDIQNNTAQFNGGGILLHPQRKETNLVVRNSRITQNSVNKINGMGGGIALHSDFYGDFSITDHSAELADVPPASVTLAETRIESNLAAGGGGIAWAEPVETNILLITEKSTLTGNRANSIAYGGGAIFNYRGTVLIEDSLFVDNYSFNGGGIFNRAGMLSIVRAQFKHNFAETNEKGAPFAASGFGGAMLNEGGQVSIEESQFLENESLFGGAIFHTHPGLSKCAVLEDAFMEIHNSCFLSNDASYAVTNYPQGDHIALQECLNPNKNPFANASDNWWGSASPPDQNQVSGDVMLDPILVEIPSFCVVK
jgi:hypothetical protein